MLFYITEIACVLLEIWLIHAFFTSLFPLKSTGPLVYIGGNALFAAVITAVSVIDIFAGIRVFICFGCILGICMVFYGCKLWQGLLFSLAITVIFAVADIITALLLQSFGIPLDSMMTGANMRLLYLVATHAVIFGLIMLLCVMNRKGASPMSPKTLLPALPCWLSTLALGVVLSWQTYVSDAPIHSGFILVLLGLLYTNVAVIYYTGRMAQQERLREALEEAEQHYALQQKYYDSLHQQQEQTRALWHDMGKYLRASQSDASDDALRQLQQMLDDIPQVVDTGNRVISVILNEYCQEAKTAGIRLHLDVQVPAEVFVSAADLYVLLGNTLDNAIEACRMLPAESKVICLKLRQQNKILFYEITNPYAEGSSAKRPGIHGYGLKNVAHCAQKYGGHTSIARENGVFCFQAHMNG